LLDTRAVDYRLLQRGPRPASPDVVIVAVDEASIERIGRWPWSRAVMARLLDRISAARPAAVGFDIVQSEASRASSIRALIEEADEPTRRAIERVLPEDLSEDDALVEAVGRAGNAVLGYFFDFEAKQDSEERPRLGTYNVVRDRGGGRGSRNLPKARRAVANLPALGAAAGDTGYFNVFPSRGDGALRKVPMAIRYAGEITLPLSLAMLRVARGEPASIELADFGVRSVKLGSTEIPVSEDGQMLLNYRGPGRTFRHLSARDVLEGKARAEDLSGKLVLVGVSAVGVGDIRVTPFDEVYPGVELHATAMDNILRRDFLWQPKLTVLLEIGVILLFCAALGLGLGRARGVAGLAVAVALLATYLATSQWLFVTRGLPLSLVYPLLAISLTYIGISVQHYVVEERERRKTRRALELYLSPSMARLVSEQPERLKLGGERREMTVLFSDIREFTAISEGLEPEALVDLLNVYLGEMTESVFSHEGMLDKYVGDAVMAVWGAPLPQADHATRACRAALMMHERLARLNGEARKRGWPIMQMGVGLNSGPMIFGNMGSTHHLSLTVMGDNVNLGARLEGLTKTYGTGIIASESTVRAAGDAIVAREIDLVRVKGKQVAVRIFDVLGLSEQRDRWSRLCERFAEGLSAYRGRRWHEALDIFSAIRVEWPDDSPSSVYVERCRATLLAPPAADWEGVTVMEVK
jgi:adenylate cyclase